MERMQSLQEEEEEEHIVSMDAVVEVRKEIIVVSSRVFLQNCDFQIRHIPGQENVVAVAD